MPFVGPCEVTWNLDARQMHMQPTGITAETASQRAKRCITRTRAPHPNYMIGSTWTTSTVPPNVRCGQLEPIATAPSNESDETIE